MVAGTVPVLVGAQDAGNAAQARAAASAPAAGGECIPADVPRALSECPSGAPRPAAKRGTSAPSSHLSTSKRRVEEKKQGPTGPTYEVSVQQAMNRENARIRQEQLLRREIEITERIVRNTRTQDPRRPDVLLRLAETYFELQQAINAKVRGFDDPIHQACTVQKNRNACQQARQGQRAAEQELTAARESAIRTYATLVQDHPNFRRMDEVLFSLGFALEEMRQFDRARQVYFRLIKGFPQSKFIPNAYLSFAEYFFGEGQMQEALQFYEKVREIPPERNTVYGYSVYKSAWAYYNLEDYRNALQKFVETIEFARANPEARDVANLVRQARRELVLPYAQVGNPQRALEFFRRYADNDEQARDMFEALGDLYYDTGKWNNAISVFHDLMAAAPNSDKLCYWQGRVTNAIISSKPKPDQVREVQRMTDLYETFIRGQHSPQSITQCKQTTASILVELSTAWHREAIGTESQPGTNDRNTMRLAAALYRLVLDKFPDMESMEFPEIDRRDWPTQYRVSYYYAELLWKMEDWAQCGPAFDKVVELNPQGEFTADAAYAAVLCYNNLYQTQYQARERETRAPRGRAQQQSGGRGRRGQQQEQGAQDASAQFRPRDFTEQERGMLNAFQRFVCFVQDSEELPVVKYRRARIYYETNHYEEAAVIFKDIAWNHRDSELAEYAANLYLDSLNILGTHREPPRASCFDTMATDVEALKGFYCSTEQGRAAHPDLCRVVTTLRCDIKRKKAEALQAARQFKEAAREYVDIYRQCQQDAETNERLPEVLYNAALNYEAARLVGRAIRVRKLLVERHPNHETAKRALYLLGANYHALAIYGQAADYYEQFATRFPGEDGSRCTDTERSAGTCANAIEALQNAVFFRLGLGETDKALEDANLFARNYRTRKPRETAQVMYSIGSVFQNQRNWTKTVDHYRGWIRTYGRSAPPQLLIMANIQIARAFRETNNASQGAPFLADTVRIWERGAADAIARLDIDDGAKALALLEAKTGVSEALFYQAESLYNEYQRIRFPEYRGQGNLEAVNRWASGDFRRWLDRKQAALQAAEAAYNKLVPLDVPQWLIAAASRIGQMYTALVDAFDDAPVPSEIENDPELYDIYVGALNEQRQIFYNQAIPKFEYCIITATRVRWFNEYSRACEAELNRLNPTQYPMANELRGQPTYIHRAMARPGIVELGQQAEEGEAADAEATGGGGGGQ
jgi:tetratricopeptide (TPR) repeat protein